MRIFWLANLHIFPIDKIKRTVILIFVVKNNFNGKGKFMTTPTQPEETFLIEDLETLRTLSDPLRMQIYEILLSESSTIRQVAERLGLAPSRLYYHMNQMEKQGLVQVAETRMVSNMVEKVYRARAYHLELAPGLLNFNTEDGERAVKDVLTGHLDATRDDLLRSLQARQMQVEQGAEKRQRNVMVNRMTARIPDSYAEEFHQRLAALIDEFGRRDSPFTSDHPDYQDYALLIAFYPSFYYKGDGQ
jgi:DNA-binding transcriptional ArsR family regulator